MTIHEIKLSAEYYEYVRAGDKNFEIRFNDLDYQVGDLVLLKRYSIETPRVGIITGEWILVKITYITNYEQKPGYIVFGFKILLEGES